MLRTTAPAEAFVLPPAAVGLVVHKFTRAENFAFRGTDWECVY